MPDAAACASTLSLFFTPLPPAPAAPRCSRRLLLLMSPRKMQPRVLCRAMRVAIRFRPPSACAYACRLIDVLMMGSSALLSAAAPALPVYASDVAAARAPRYARRAATPPPQSKGNMRHVKRATARSRQHGSREMPKARRRRCRMRGMPVSSRKRYAAAPVPAVTVPCFMRCAARNSNLIAYRQTRGRDER